MPPRWSREPHDTALMLGQAVVINCEAEGYPQPQITWLKGGNNSLKKKTDEIQCYSKKLMVLLGMSFG